MVFRIAEELRAVGAIPGELAGITRHRRLTLMGADRDAEPKTEAAEMRLDVGDLVLDLGPEMIGYHQADGFRAEDALAVEFAAIDQHLPEADVVADGGER